MKTTHWLAIPVIILTAACGSGDKGANSNIISTNKDLEKALVVARMEKINGEDLTICNLKSLKKSIDIPLSSLAEELHIVKLDERDEALVRNNKVTISDNYILVHSYRKSMPYKLFSKDGSYICSIGGFGQGPGEYTTNIYDQQIDEYAERIYLMPWNAKEILTYNMQGEYEGSIPLNKKYPKQVVPKGLFRVDSRANRATVCSLPFEHLEAMAWVQDMEGNILQEIPTRHLKFKSDFGNEMTSLKSTDAFEVNIMKLSNPRKDTLYHYDRISNRLLPRFTIDFGGDEAGIHAYHELPNHYLAETYVMKKVSKTSSVTSEPQFFIIDKKSLRGGTFKVYNDYLGGLEIPYFYYSCNNGYFTGNWEPQQFKEYLTRALKENPNMPINTRERIETLLSSIDENSNNYILYAKLRK